MFKLLIVDDEELDREGLREQIDWEEYNVLCAGTAKNGFDALRKFADLDPDIVISDVKMPGMTGLKLVGELRKVKPSIKVVFVSGYDDFEYARTAIQLEAIEYILKPINSGELKNTILRVVTSLEQERNEKEQIELLSRLAEEGKSLQKERLLMDIIYGTIGKEQLAKAKELFRDSEGGNCFVITMIDIEEYLDQSPRQVNENSSRKLTALEELLKNRIIECFKIDLLRLQPGKLIILLSSTAQGIREGYLEAIKKEFLLISEEINKLLELTITTAVGSFVNNIEEVYKSYDSCCDLMHSKLHLGKGSVITYLNRASYDKGNKKVIDKVKKYIEDNYSKDISLKEIAYEMYYSPNHLGLLIKEFLGKGFNEFLVEYRMQKASELLKNPSLRIYEVAQKVSYKNLTAFNNKFKEFYGAAPKEYRERY